MAGGAWKHNFANGYQPGDVFASLFGIKRKNSGGYDPLDFGHSATGDTGTTIWEDLTGKTNTITQNTAAAALQEDAQTFNRSESAEQRAWQSEEAQKNRDWQTEMSNTAVQRMAADYKAAGFNPILAASGNGASLGSPVMSTGSAASSAVGATQASNVNALAAVGTAAAGIGILIKALKMAAK